MKKHSVPVVIISLVLAVAVFAGGYLFAYGRFVGWDVMFEQSPNDWFSQKSAILLDTERVDPEIVQTFNRVLSLMDRRYYKELDINALLDSAVMGLAAGAEDPYTSYHNPEDMKQYMEMSSGNYVGIGVQVVMDDKKLLTVESVFDGSPAQEVGIRKDDKIIKVDGIDVTTYDNSSDIVKLIKGVPDTKVVIQVYRPETAETKDFTITRKLINSVNVESKMLDASTGYIWIKQFDNDVATDFQQQYNALNAKGMKSLVIDLRDNPGGDYYEVVRISDMLLPEGTIVYTMDRNGNKKEQKSDASAANIPIAVLVNGYSASASEILSAALQDFERGIVIGTTTFGKGLVQTVDGSMPNGGGLTYTTAAYYTPSGRSIHEIGVVPDIEVKLDEKYDYVLPDEIPEEDDLQLQRAIAELAKQ